MIYFMLFLLSYFGVWWMRSHAPRAHSNHRTLHHGSVSTGGGVVFVVLFYVAIIFLYFQSEIDPKLFYALWGGIPLAFVGFLDDIKHIKPIYRLLIQFSVVVWAMLALGLWEHFAWWQTILLMLSGVWLINLYNFLDGIDGYAASEAIFVAGAAMLFFHDITLLILIAVLSGFLLHNWHKAKIFMGDTGSTFLGFLFFCMALYHSHSPNDLLLWLMLLGLFIFDATVTLIRRALAGEKLMSAHRKHLFQRAVQMGFSHDKVVMIATGINLTVLWGIIYLYESRWLYLYFICYMMLLFILMRTIDKAVSFEDY